MMGEDLLTLALVLLGRLCLLPFRWLFRRGVWHGLRLLALGAVVAVTARDLATAGWNPAVFALQADEGTIMPLAALLFLCGGLLLLGPKPAAPTTHGSATWASGRELRGLVVGRRRPLPPGALALAPYGALRQLALPPARAMQHTLVVGPSGAGKTRGLFMPNAAAAQGSFVATDPKGELWAHTSGLHAETWRFAPREPDASRCFNWIPWCRDPRLAELLATAAMQLETDAFEQQFWKLADMQCCAALFAHAAYQPIPTPATAAALLELGPSDLVGCLQRSPAPRARRCARMLAELKPETRAGIVLSVANKLAFLQEPAVARFTSAEAEATDFAALLQRPIAAYWVLHEQDVGLLQPLSSVFFTLLLDQLSRASGPVPATLFLDEFANLGRLPSFATTISVARGRGLALVLSVQALSQLDGRYGRHDADTIRTNCATKVILHGLDWHSAEEVSRLLGEGTVRQEYTSRRPSSLLVTSYTYSEHQTQRRLLTADEVRRLREDELLVVIGNLRPIRTGRWFWKEPANPAPAPALGPAVATPPPMPLPAGPPRRGGDPLRERLRRLDDEP